MADKKKSGKFGILFNMEKGALIEGDGATALADNTWFRIDAYASSGSALPFSPNGKKRFFKSPDSGNAITPAIGDDVFPITLEKVCTTDTSLSAEKGTIDVTDKCTDGYNESIVDGFTGLSGSFAAFIGYSETTGIMNAEQVEFFNRFYDKQSDDGEGVYDLVAKNDNDMLLAILKNQDQAATVGNTQEWIIIPVILSSMTADDPLKGAQNQDLSFEKGEGPATLYSRVTNATESVF
jgi:hypothetical protein